MRRRIRIVIALVTLAIGIGFQAGPDDGTTLQDVMELNRSGGWAAAADLADAIAESDEPTPLERCEAYYHAAYARVRLGRLGEATSLISRFDADCAEIQTDHWVHREMAKVREEAAQAFTPPPDDSWLTGNAAELGLDPALVHPRAPGFRNRPRGHR